MVVVGVLILPLLDNFSSSSFLVASSKSIYVRNIIIRMMITRQEAALTPIVHLVRDVPTTRTLVSLHLNDRNLYISSQIANLLIIQNIDKLMKNDQNPALFQANAFYSHLNVLLHEFPVCDLKQREQ